MKIPAILTLLASGISMAGLAAEQPQVAAVVHLDHDAVAAAFAKGAPLFATNNFKIQAGHRMEPGEVEVHDTDTDIFYVLDGSATFVTGGKPVEPRTTGPGETRAKSINGGLERRLTKGDIIVIPNRVPHWFKAVKGPLSYFVVKVSK